MAVAAVGAVAVAGSAYSASQSGKAADKAAETQAESSEAGIAEQRRQFDKITELLSPYVSAGTGAIGQQQAILGLQGAGAQQKAISGIEQSPYFKSVFQQGENAILQNASATGGLRGGNTQGALAQFRPALLNQLIQQQYSNLGGLTNVGQASAAQQAVAAGNTGANISNLLGQQGAAVAGGQLAQGAAQSQLAGNLVGIAGGLYGAYGGGGGGYKGAYGF
jgi:hypothetical protein